MGIFTSINGVDTTRIAALRDKLQNEPGQGDTIWKAEVVWQSGFSQAISDPLRKNV